MSRSGKSQISQQQVRATPSEYSFSVIDTLGIALVILDLQGKITHFNKAAETYSGYRSSEVLGKYPWEFLIARDDAGVLKQAFDALKSSGLQTEMDTTWITNEGYQRMFHWSNAPVIDEGGKLKWIVDVFVDVTDERKSRAQLALAKQDLEMERQINRFLSEASYRIYTSSLSREKRLELLASLPIPTISDWSFAVLQGRNAGTYLKTAHHWDRGDPAKSQALSQLLAWKADETIPKFLANAYSYDGTQVDNPLEAVSAEQWALLHELGWHSWFCIPICGSHLRTRGAILLASREGDTTDLKNNKRIAEEFVSRVIPLLDQAAFYEDAMHAIHMRDEFISVASHELRTPLTSLRMQFQLLKSQPSFEFIHSSRGQKLIADADQQLVRMSKLVLEMLDTVSISLGKLHLETEEFDLQDLVRDVVNQLSEMANQKGVQIRFKSNAPVVGRWDRFRMEQVVTNVLMNAIKFGQGRPVDVRIGTFKNQAYLEVEDQGPGIREADFQKIFDRFEQTSAAQSGGLGLGLYISRQIVRAHGGEITVESQVNKGAKFRIQLPVREVVQKVG